MKSERVGQLNDRQRQTAVDDFLVQQDICPWGKAAATQARISVEYLRPGLVGDIELRRALSEFSGVQTGTALVVVLSHDRTIGAEALERVAAAGWLRLRHASLRLFNAELSRRERQEIAHRELRQLVDRRCPVRPYPLFGGKPVTITAMGPAYPSAHPRYAPFPLLCVVWNDDLAATPLKPKEAHRLRMAALAGHPYDADELVLREGALR